ncbi:sensor histidine kinase, partial [Caulobacter sp. S45]|uniref:sensor histidine kinase n=1 Tax=Caulobacter sp. S45 TaxID=1641861 RepID=UPI001C2068A5
MTDAQDPDDPPPSPQWNETDRLAALASYAVMDTPPEGPFDDIVRIAAQICGTPMALISLVDGERQWFKSALGVEARETPREIAFCAHAIQQKGLFTVADATRDPRFAENPLVTGDPGLRFYAGSPLETPEGLPLGTLCVLDRTPRELSPAQQSALDALGRQVMAQLELRSSLARQRSSDERHRRILESAIDYGIITMDLKGVVTSWNEGARRILGWSEAEMCGRLCDDFFTPEDCDAGVPDREMGHALTHGRASDERWHLRRDDTRFWASGEMMPLLNEDDQPVGFLKILRDRTEFRRAQEALQASEKAAERDRRLLTSELEHRVKNTLAIVQAIVSQTLRNVATPAEARRKIEDRLVSLGRAHDILTSTSWSTAPIGSIIAAATEIHGSGPERIRAAGPDLKIQARAAVGLSMALHELCTNAAKYGALSNEAGQIDIA